MGEFRDKTLLQSGRILIKKKLLSCIMGNVEASILHFDS